MNTPPAGTFRVEEQPAARRSQFEVLGFPGFDRHLVARRATRYTSSMIKSFLHKGLKRLYETGSKSGIQAKHAKRLRMQLTALDTAVTIDDMDIPGFKLHALKGKDRGRWSIWVNGNWRITFEFRDGHAYVLDYEDYH
jgi:proteic killer suppression protein